MADDAKDELKALVLRARQENQGPFPETLRQRLLRYAVERWKAGVSVRTVAAELGMSGHTLSYWKAQAMGFSEKVRPVKVIEKPAAKAKGYTLSGPSGTRLDDVSLDEIAELFRKLS